MGNRFAFATHLSQDINDFVMEQLRLGLTLFQIMAKHRGHVKNIMLKTCELNRDMFLIEQDVKVFSRKLVQETYQLHKNDAKNVRMWVQQKINSMFYYQETKVEMDVVSLGKTCLSLWVSKHHGKRR
jgi:hypothetical protein